MNYKRILISEVEKKRILGLHNTTKKNQTTRLINEAQDKPNLFPVCVRWAGQHVQIPVDIPTLAGTAGQLYAVHVPNAGGKGIDYYWSQETDAGRVMAIVKSGATEPEQIRSYNCVCKNGRCSAKSYSDQDFKKEHECSDKKPCVKSGDQGGNQGGNQGGDCSKGPMELVVSMGLNWKETRQKWIDANCNGTTPCILGDARTNINLRDAICKGTWDPKTGKQKEGTIPGGQTPGGQTPGGQTPGGQTPGGQTPTDGEKRFIEPIFPGDEQTIKTPVAD